MPPLPAAALLLLLLLLLLPASSDCCTVDALLLVVLYCCCSGLFGLGFKELLLVSMLLLLSRLSAAELWIARHRIDPHAGCLRKHCLNVRRVCMFCMFCNACGQCQHQTLCPLIYS
jgi:hypothetical protein